jgi:formamidopyrimidine-DNA glycosylase
MACRTPDEAMPELPEVETVRRGLEPAMDGARFSKVELRRGDLRWPLPKDFVARLEGKTVTGLAAAPNICSPIFHRATCW